MPPNNYDQERLERLARGDVTAFDEIVADHQPAIARLVHRLLAWDDEVEDVVQDVFLAAWRHLPRFRRQASLATWLRQIAVNQCRSRRRWWRARIAQRRRIGQAPSVPVVPSAEQRALDREIFEQVQAAVKALPHRDREVIVLHYLEQQSVDQVAAELGLRRNAVEVRLHRARRRLKPLLVGIMTDSLDES